MISDEAWRSIATIAGVLVAGIPPTLVAWATLRQSKNNYQQSSTQAHDANLKADKLIEKTTEIHTLTNSTLSAAMAALAESTAKNLGLERLVGILMAANKEAAVTAIDAEKGKPKP